jgi:glutathione S-transferase
LQSWSAAIKGHPVPAIDNDAPPLEIIGRRSSLFTRIAMMFAETLRVPWRLTHVPDMTALVAGAYADNPAMKLPVLRVDQHVLFGSEHICRALAAKAAEHRPVHVVWTEDLPYPLSRNAQELVWHCAAAQVQLVMGVAIAGLPADNVFFVKTRKGMEASLSWLDRNVKQVVAALPAGRDISLFETTLFCLIEHLSFRPTVALGECPALLAFAARVGNSEAARATSYRFDAVQHTG